MKEHMQAKEGVERKVCEYMSEYTVALIAHTLEYIHADIYSKAMILIKIYVHTKFLVLGICWV